MYGAREAIIDCPSRNDRPLLLNKAAAPTARRSNKPRPNTMGTNKPPLNKPPELLLDAPVLCPAPYPGAAAALLLATG